MKSIKNILLAVLLATSTPLLAQSDEQIEQVSQHVRNLAAEEQYEEALKLVDAELKKSGKNEELEELRGFVLVISQDYTEATKYLRRSIRR